jgi:hypothetical protein
MDLHVVQPSLLQDRLFELVYLTSQHPAKSFYLSSIVQCHRLRVKFNVKVLLTLKLKLNLSTVFFQVGLFVFLALQPTVVVFSQPCSGL